MLARTQALKRQAVQGLMNTVVILTINGAIEFVKLYVGVLDLSFEQNCH